MINRPDDTLINIFAGNSANRTLSELEVQLVLVQSACLMALEGTNRASASEIAARALKEYRVETTASFAGQSFSILGIGSVTTHGKNRLVLDADQLEEIRQGLITKCRAKMEKLKEAVEKFKDLPQRITELQEEWKEALSQRAREQELVRLINEDRRNPSRLEQYQAEYQKIQKRNEYIEAVKKEIKSLEKKEQKLPSLEEKKKSVQARLTEHEKAIQAIEAQEKGISLKEQQLDKKAEDITKREEALGPRLSRLQKRLDMLEYADLEQAIEASKKDLDDLARQLGEKRSLLDKMLGRNKGVSS